MLDANQIEDLFTYHPPTPDQIPRYTKIRDAAKAFAHVLLECAPDSADRMAAIRKLRECVMTANAAIALEQASKNNPTVAVGMDGKRWTRAELDARYAWIVETTKWEGSREDFICVMGPVENFEYRVIK